VYADVPFADKTYFLPVFFPFPFFGAVVAVVWGWGVAQRPYLLPTSLKIDAGAAPHATLVALVIVLGVAVLVIGPAMALLFTLHQRSVLDD